MAFTTDSISSVSDLVQKLATWFAANGWSLDHLDTSTTAGTGGEWAMNRVQVVPAAVTSIDGTTDVDDANEEFDLTTHGFDDGQFVRYNEGGDAVPITGLTDGQHYYVHKIDNNTISLHDLQADALADVNRIGLTDTASSTTNILTPIGFQIRFAASWDAENSGEVLALYQYAEQAYVIGDRPWGQDHCSGNGHPVTTPDADIDDDRHVFVGSAPQRYWAFEGDDYTHVVIRTSDGVYQHFGFGLSDKLGGDWIGGEYVYGQRNNFTVFTGDDIQWDGISYLLDGLVNDTGDDGGKPDDMELFAATIRCEGMPNQTSGGMWGVCMGGKVGSPQTDFGLDRQSNDGVSSDTGRELFTWGLRAGPFAQGFNRFDGEDVSGHTAMWPIACTYLDQTTGYLHGYPILRMKDVVGINMKDYTPTDEITLAGGSETWMIFPAGFKYPGSGIGSSGLLGIAYKKVT